MRALIMSFILAGLWVGTVQAQSFEFTPGPRMIRAIEGIAHEYLAMEKTARLTAQQKRAIHDLIRNFKKDMWRKEAVLVGMFQELEEKRRYGLLKENEYKTANVLTAGIETDELNFLIQTLSTLQGILTEAQRDALQRTWRPTLTFGVPQGITTKIALQSLRGIGRSYDGYRDELDLTDSQATALRALLEAARAELLRVGTAIDVNRTEAYELLKHPGVDPEVVRTKMQKTGELEGVLFNKLFEVTRQVKTLLTAEQRERLRALTQRRHSRPPAARPHGTAHSSVTQSERDETLAQFQFFLDQIETLGLTREQVAELVTLKYQTRKTTLFDQAARKGVELDLLDLLHRRALELQVQGEEREVRIDEKIEAKIHQLQEVMAKITHAQVLAYLEARQILTAGQQHRIRPVRTVWFTP